MLQALVSTASKLFNDLNRSWLRDRGSPWQPSEQTSSKPARNFQGLKRVVLTDGVARTLFEEFASHKEEECGQDETGWVLLGLREADQAVVLATLPAGTECDASASHVLFNSSAQALGSRIVRQQDRQLTMVGVVHTHPGSLRHPSEGDYRGDCEWVQKLRGQEGVFGIGTADGGPLLNDVFAQQPKPHVQCLGELCFSWYSLRFGDAGYRPLPVSVTLGPDLARPLHSVWSIVEVHADQLERLYRQQAGVSIDIVEGSHGSKLSLDLPLAEPETALRVLLSEKEVCYYLLRSGEMLAVDMTDDRVDRGVYLLLAELAAEQ